MKTITIESLKEIVRTLAPNQYNSIIIDTASGTQCFNYCYITTYVQHVDYKTKRIDAALDNTLRQKLETIIHNEDSKPYTAISDSFVDGLKSVPSCSIDGLFSSTKNKIGELIGGGRDVNHSDIVLLTDGNRLSKQQNAYAIKSECMIIPCPHCEGKGTVVTTDKQGKNQTVQCKKCNGYGQVGRLTYFTPTVSEKQTSTVHCLEGEIAGLNFSVKNKSISVSGSDFKVLADEPTLMVRHYNGIDEENIPADLLPYMELLRDKIGSDNALEEFFYRIIPCYTFNYRDVLTNTFHTGVVITPEDNPHVIFNLSKFSEKVFDGMKQTVKSLGRFFGSIRKSDNFKDTEDLKRSIRLLIAVVTSDGEVNQKEKQALILTLRNTDCLTAKEINSLEQLLSEPDANFITDDDFAFHNKAIEMETISRMEELAQADSSFHEKEHDLIYKLKSKYL